MRYGVKIAVIDGVTNRVKSEAGEKHLRILIVDDSPRMRKSLNDAVSVLPRLMVVGEAKDGFEALQSVHVLKPDVMTLDIHMPNMSGLEVLQRIKQEECVIVVLTALDDEFYREKCRKLKARHFFDKITEFDQFLDFLKTM